MALTPDGKIVAVGSAGDKRGFAVARYNPDGSLDKSFSSDGKVLTKMNLEDSTSDLLIQPDGKILLVQGEIARYLADGSLDPSFAGNGILERDELPIRSVSAVQLQPDGKTVVAGTTGGEYAAEFGVARLMPDGVADPSFGSGGSVATFFSCSQTGKSCSPAAMYRERKASMLATPSSPSPVTCRAERSTKASAVAAFGSST